MTVDEAIICLSDMKIKVAIPKAAVTQIKRNLALDMAISALNCSEIPNNSDIISRQAAIDEITEYGSGDTVYMSVVELKRRIEQLPSAQPERKTGRWITDDSELGIKCNKCGKSFSDYVNAGTEYMFLEEIPNFCPNCGAKMEKR